MLNEIIILEVLFQASKIPSLYTWKSLDLLSLVTKPPMISLHERNQRNPQRWRKAPNMGTIGPRSFSHISVLEACLVCGAGQTHCTRQVKDVSLMRRGARSSGFPERAGLTCPLHGRGLATVGRASTHTAGTTVGHLRRERPHSLGSNYLTPQGSTGKILQGSVLPLHQQMFNIRFEKLN